MARLLWPSALLAALLLSAACGVLGAIDEAKAAADLATVCGDSTELTGCSLAAKCEVRWAAMCTSMVWNEDIGRAIVTSASFYR